MLKILFERIRQGHRTIKFPKQAPVLSDRFRGMPTVDHAQCTASKNSCRACADACPTDAIALLASACSDDPSEPTYRLDLAEAQMAAGQSEQAVATLAEVRATGTLTRPLRVRAANLESGAASFTRPPEP